MNKGFKASWLDERFPPVLEAMEGVKALFAQFLGMVEKEGAAQGR